MGYLLHNNRGRPKKVSPFFSYGAMSTAGLYAAHCRSDRADGRGYTPPHIKDEQRRQQSHAQDADHWPESKVTTIVV
jgi:hypothetical protein